MQSNTPAPEQPKAPVAVVSMQVGMTLAFPDAASASVALKAAEEFLTAQLEANKDKLKNMQFQGASVQFVPAEAIG